MLRSVITDGGALLLGLVLLGFLIRSGTPVGATQKRLISGISSHCWALLDALRGS
ncbi:hypothetical protein [Saccharopolyspora spinosa]|uniref:Uncharacterized protein n=1 Tax=Saccharopolyspora spinosa TaxID=60894 RepID=A0A2N3XWL2_SACSN|nr:hypothetical protein [Saccharopolyspora spinosa]PKW15058.1 hypothetical protein A8926_2736 [Saccharopolyspora spinosa]